MGKLRSNDRAGYIFYIGGYLDESIVAERGLPTHNKAGSNRMCRLAEAIRTCGQRILIISPAVTMRMRWMGQLVHPFRVHTTGKVPVLFCAALGLPVVGMLLELFFLLSALVSAARRRRVAAVLIYNFSPTLLLVALWVRLLWRVPIVNNVEDISVPKWVDWLPGSRARPVQQLVFAVCMVVIIRLSDRIIIPTRRFTSFIPRGKPYIVIPGCMPSCVQVSEPAPGGETGHLPIQLLYAGKVEFEHGIQHLLRAMSLLSQDGTAASALRVHICGTGSKVQWVLDYLPKLKGLDIQFHGFVSDKEYQHLLSQVDVCFVLQDPAGRYAAYKTPSKAYEYLGYGKMVIATDVGDLTLLPPEVITICYHLNERGLYTEIAAIANDPERPRRQGKAAQRYAQEHFAYPQVGPRICDFILGTPNQSSAGKMKQWLSCLNPRY